MPSLNDLAVEGTHNTNKQTNLKQIFMLLLAFNLSKTGLTLSRFFSCDGSDRIRYETTGYRRGSGICLKSGPLQSTLSYCTIDFSRLSFPGIRQAPHYTSLSLRRPVMAQDADVVTPSCSVRPQALVIKFPICPIYLNLCIMVCHMTSLFSWAGEWCAVWKSTRCNR